jgi:hypothetical protein
MPDPTTTASPPRGSVAAGKPAPAGSGLEGLDIRQVISGSTSDVAVSELSRKGFKNVKVLNQATITKLIAEAVDRVISLRCRQIGREERDRVVQEAQAQFEGLAKERLRRERDRIGELERANATLLRESEELKARLRDREAEIARLQAAPAPAAGPSEKLLETLLERLPALSAAKGGDVADLQKSIQSIAAKLDRLPAAGRAGSVGAGVDEEAMIDALFRLKADEGAESNVAQVKVKEAKAGGVKDTLAKLKAMQKGGKDGD